MAKRVVVVGGGLAGLTAALDLQSAGADVVVLEKGETLGGRAKTDQIDGYHIDPSAQLFGSMYTRYRALVDRLGLSDRLVRSPGRDALLKSGRAQEVVYGSASSMLASRAIPFGTKVRLGTTYLPFLTKHSAHLDQHCPEKAVAAGLDEETIAAWGEREMGKDFVDYLVYPQLAGYYGSLPEETGAALYHILARYGVDVTVYAVRGGAGGVADEAGSRIREAGGEVRTGTRVSAVGLVDGGVRVTTDTGEEAFDAAVIATPADDALRILGSSEIAIAAWLQGVRTRGAVSVAFLMDKPADVRFFGLSLPRAESTTLSTISVQENKGGELVPEGRGALVAFVRPDVVAELIDLDSQQIVDAVLPDIERGFPGAQSSVRRARVYRWAGGNPIFYPGYLRHLTRHRSGEVEGEGPIALAGDYLYMPSVEGAVVAGADAARRIVKRIMNGD